MIRIGALLGVAAAAMIGGTALAQSHGGGGHGWHGGGGGGHGGWSGQGGGGGFHGRDFGRLSPGERAHWARGEWRHTWHGGVFGWWWFLDDDWYLYPAPAYPYPAYLEDSDEGPPGADGPQGGPMPPPQHFWYRCAEPAGFYPYVRSCPSGWTAVPTTPPDGPEPRNAPPPPPPPGEGR